MLHNYLSCSFSSPQNTYSKQYKQQTPRKNEKKTPRQSNSKGKDGGNILVSSLHLINVFARNEKTFIKWKERKNESRKCILDIDNNNKYLYGALSCVTQSAITPTIVKINIQEETKLLALTLFL